MGGGILIRRRGLLLTVALLLVLTGCIDGAASTSKSAATPGAAGQSAQPAAAKTPPPDTVLVVDASGTMKQTDVDPSRMGAAQQAATTLLDSLPADSKVGLLAYGTATGNADSDKPAGCKDVTTLVKTAALAPEQLAALKGSVAGLKPRGYTPIGLALGEAAKQVPNATGNIVLISDGEDTCAPPDPCDVATELKQQHPKLTISTVGFRTDTDASKQLSCIAATTGGVFVTADDPSQLVNRLKAASNVNASAAVLTTGGQGSIQLGQTNAGIRANHPDFPGAEAAKPYSGTVPGSDLFVVTWRDCHYVFDKDGTLVGIEPKTGRTADNVATGNKSSTAVAAYGKPEQVSKNDNGSYTAIFTAEKSAGTAYRMVLTAPLEAAASTIKLIVLCRCSVAHPVAAAQPTAGSTSGGSGSVPSWVPCPATAVWAVSGRTDDGIVSLAKCSDQVLTMVTDGRAEDWQFLNSDRRSGVALSPDETLRVGVDASDPDEGINFMSNGGNYTVTRVIPVNQRWMRPATGGKPPKCPDLATFKKLTGHDELTLNGSIKCSPDGTWAYAHINYYSNKTDRQGSVYLHWVGDEWDNVTGVGGHGGDFHDLCPDPTFPREFFSDDSFMTMVCEELDTN